MTDHLDPFSSSPLDSSLPPSLPRSSTFPTNATTPSSSSSLSLPPKSFISTSTSHLEQARDTPPPSSPLRRPTYARHYGGLSLNLPDAVRIAAGLGEGEGWGRGRSTTMLNNPNHTFMQMINALAIDEGTLHLISDHDDSTPVTPSDPVASSDHLPAALTHLIIPERSFDDRDTSDDDDEDQNPFYGTAGEEEGDDEHEMESSPEMTERRLEEASITLTPPVASPPTAMTEDMSSSLHALHRPIAAARRRALTGELGVGTRGDGSGNGASISSRSTLRVNEVPVASSSSTVQLTPPVGYEGGRGLERTTTQVSMVRKERLADKLADIFGLEGGEEVIAEFPCWLFRSVLLQGFVYLTTGHICFYAYLPPNQGKILRSGSLSARGARTRVYHKHWFVVKDNVMSWYADSTETYFLDGHIDLHYCTAVEASAKHKNHFKVSTAEKKWHFSADSEANRDEWVKLIQKVVFKAQNESESVKIAIPLETIVDIERASLEFAETVRIRVYDADEGYSIDEYWLSYFSDLDGALAKMTQVLESFRDAHPEVRQAVSILDSTSKNNTVATPTPTSPTSSTFPLCITKSFSSTPAVGSSSSGSASPTVAVPHRSASSLSSRLGFGHRSSPTPSLKTIPSPSPGTPRDSTEIDRASSLDSNQTMVAPSSSSATDTYPPDPSPDVPPLVARHSSSSSSWSIPSIPSVPAWLKGPPKRLLSTTNSVVRAPVRKILEVVSGVAGNTSHSETGQRGRIRGNTLERDSTTSGGVIVEEEDDGNEKFRMMFGLGEKEVIVSQFPAYLFRGLPIYGKVYISTSYFCFKSIGILAKTKMILPLNDIIAVSKHRSYRIGYSGLIVVIKGHEEIFFELASSDRRDRCMHDLESQLDALQTPHLLADDPQHPFVTTPPLLSTATSEQQDHLDLIEFAKARSVQLAASRNALPSSPFDQAHPRLIDAVRPPPETSSAGQPPAMFCSTSSDFVTFRPEKSLRFTCLTIGSRGDVQPYIALCRGLMAEGHTCKIASHAEYRSWVEGHGIGFEEIGGDPAELMQLMIAHDFFTIAFMKEAIGRFRGWLDDLLETTWLACQGSDVLIESPSAIAGLHIAEALRIPYYRAFTMPWSRTRAYPHAFAVPDHKMGGGYNYMTYTMFDQIFWRATAGQVNRWRKKTLGLKSTSLEAMRQHKIPFLYNFSPVIVPPPLDWRENIHVTGYWILDNPDDSAAQKWVPPPELLAFLDLAQTRGKKVVFIGFGSIIIPDPEEMTRVVTEAVERAGVFAVIAKGWSDRATTKAMTEEKRNAKEAQEVKEASMMKRENIFNIKSIPHDWLFPRIHAAVHHGGAGTTGASLRAGLPTIIKPFFGDQYFYADRVATLGIGSAVRDMTVDHLASAIITAVTDEKQISRARLAGEAIRKEDGVGMAIECIYRDLEYSKSLLPSLKESRLLPPSGSRQESTSSLSTTTPTSLATPPLSAKEGVSNSTPSSPPRRAYSVFKKTRKSTGQQQQQQTSGGGEVEGSSDESSSWDIVSASGNDSLVVVDK